MANCHFINAIDRTPLLFKLNTFLYNQIEADLPIDLCYSLAPLCNDSLAEAEHKWVILSYLTLHGDE